MPLAWLFVVKDQSLLNHFIYIKKTYEKATIIHSFTYILEYNKIHLNIFLEKYVQNMGLISNNKYNFNLPYNMFIGIYYG